MKQLIIAIALLLSTSILDAYGSPAPSEQQKNLIEEPKCEELLNLCNHVAKDDLSILECVHSFTQSQIEQISDECQHDIWTHTRRILEDSEIRKITSKYCETSSCDNIVGNGYLACLLDKADEMHASCVAVVQRLESVAFTDYRNLDHFLADCEEDIVATKCGRLPDNHVKVSQGETLACLEDHIEQLKNQCKARVFKIAQQQAENLKLDRQFFLACEKDFINLCSDVPASKHFTSGTWAFKCLLKKKLTNELSPKCRSQITRREKLLSQDYQVSRGLVKACKKDIQQNHCRKGVSEDKSVRLAQILLCLETVMKNGTKIADDCHVEIAEHRRMLMSDFQMNPEVFKYCGDDISKYCNQEDSSNLLTCLMQHVKTKKRQERVTSECVRALEDLIKTSDAGEDWRVDPVLRKNCQPIVEAVCKDTPGGEARVINCLMDHLDSPAMTDECEQSLLLIQYFVARNFKLDPLLYKHCKEDAVKYCHSKKTWDDVLTIQADPERGPLIFPCLHRMATETDGKTQPLKKNCISQIRRAMKQRANSVHLIPEVEDECLDDLAKFCPLKTKKGEEMQCLQDNLDQLDKHCNDAVKSFTIEEAGNVEMNPIVMRVCKNVIQNQCSSVYKPGEDEGDTMECLITHKSDPDVRPECRAAIEHFQIISLKDYHFTFKFKQSCKDYVRRFCSFSTTKNEVVACLSEIIRNDTITGKSHSIPKDCRKQVKEQLLQQRSSINLNPKLAKACQTELIKFCDEKEHDGAVLECLQSYTNRLGDTCRHEMFKFKKSELSDSATDYTLMKECKEMAFQFCSKESESSKLLDCLKIYKDEPTFDQRCHLVVVNRLIEQNTDYRFNPSLQMACGKNINEYCSTVVARAQENEELNGKVVHCLTDKFRENKLEEKCQKKMIELLKEQALNYKFNPLLRNLCEGEIKFYCKENMENDDGMVEECLKTAFSSGKNLNPECKFEIVNLIAEAKADIHVDPLLQRACSNDLLKYCSNVKSGNGRQLNCLQKILDSQPDAMDNECREKLSKRMEMFKNADKVLPPENMEELVNVVISSPAHKFFLVVALSFVGFFFLIGMFMGRVTKKAHFQKLK